jgi:hypothetical protein
MLYKIPHAAKPQADIAIKMARSADGSVIVFPALEA